MTTVTLQQIFQGIYLLRLPLPFRLNHVNSFLIEGEKGYTIIDAGLHTEKTAQIWDEVLKGRPVEKIIITHYHPDHYGFAGQLQQKTGAPVYMSATDARIVRQFWTADYLGHVRQFYSACGLPDSLIVQLNSTVGRQGLAISSHPETDGSLCDGQTIQMGIKNYTVIATPGHADGMVCFYQPESKLLFAADHILPHITPNVTYWPLSDPDPLKSYLDSLNKMKEFDVEWVIPSHGEPFKGMLARIGEIIEHHQQRLESLLQRLTQWTTIHQACLHLFGDRNLNTHDLRFAIGETVAHLEYLVHLGEVVKMENQKGWWLYQRR